MRLGAPSVSKILRWQCSRHALLPLAVRCMHIPPAFTLQAAWGLIGSIYELSRPIVSLM